MNSSFLSTLNDLNESQRLELLEKDFSSQELINLLEELLALDPKIKTDFELYDCCGTGGDKANTFNISTTTAICAAATGTKICKNGGRSSSSKTGSIDVLEALGLKLDKSLEAKLTELENYNLSFHNSTLIAQTLAPLKNLARKNKLSSFLSLLGPFTNPFLLEGQIIGVGKKAWFTKMQGLARHCIKQGYVKKIALLQSYTDDGQVFDELTSLHKAKIQLIGLEEIELEFKPEDFGLGQGRLENLHGCDNHQDNAKVINKILSNTAEIEKIETVLINHALLASLKKLKTDNFQELINTEFRRGQEVLTNLIAQKNWQQFIDNQV